MQYILIMISPPQLILEYPTPWLTQLHPLSFSLFLFKQKNEQKTHKE